METAAPFKARGLNDSSNRPRTARSKLEAIMKAVEASEAHLQNQLTEIELK